MDKRPLPNKEADAFLNKHGRVAFKITGDVNCLFRSLSHIVYGTELGHPEMRKLLLDFVKRNRQMFEPLLITATFEEHTERMAYNRVFGSHVELQAAASLFEMPVYLCTISPQDGQYKWTQYKPFPPDKLVYPPSKERPTTLNHLSHIELFHTGGNHFDCVLCISDQLFSLAPPEVPVKHFYDKTLRNNVCTCIL